MKTTVAVLDKCGENAVDAVTSVLAQTFPENDTHFGLATPTNLWMAKNLESLCSKKLRSTVAVGYASTAPIQIDTQILKMEDETAAFDGRIYVPTLKGSAAEFLAEKISGNFEETSAFLNQLEGDFSLLIIQEGRILIARDPVGVQPLYYGENENVAATASNRKALWGLGIAEPKSFPPGHFGTAAKEGFKIKAVQTLTFAEPKTISMDDAAKELQKLLEQSVKRRVYGAKEVAVAFSGGLDSSVVAYLAAKCGVDVCLVYVSLVDQSETEEARKAADLLGLPLHVHLFTEADVENVASKVVELIEEPDPVKAAIGVPFFWNAQKAAEAGFRVLLAGQGADELFGGYQRYVTEYLSRGDEAVRKTMFHDVVVIHESNIERDEKICSFHDVELRLPFASFQVAEFALSLPTDLKFERQQDSRRKLVLRKAALNMGLPSIIADKPKKAIQYSTGISNSLKKIAKKHQLTLAEYVNVIYEESRK